MSTIYNSLPPQKRGLSVIFLKTILLILGVKCDAHQYADSPRDSAKLIVSCNICAQRYPIDAIEVHLKNKHKIDLRKLIGKTSVLKYSITTTIENVAKAAPNVTRHEMVQRDQTSLITSKATESGQDQTSLSSTSKATGSVPATTSLGRTRVTETDQAKTSLTSIGVENSIQSFSPRKSPRKNTNPSRILTKINDSVPPSMATNENASPQEEEIVTMDTNDAMETPEMQENEESSTASLSLLASLAVEQQPMKGPLTVDQQPMKSPVIVEQPMGNLPEKSTVIITKPYKNPLDRSPARKTKLALATHSVQESEELQVTTPIVQTSEELTVTTPTMKTTEELEVTTPEVNTVYAKKDAPLVGTSYTSFQSVTPSPMHLPATMKRSPSKPMHLLYEAATAALGKPVEEEHTDDRIKDTKDDMAGHPLPVLKVSLPRVTLEGDSWVLSDTSTGKSDSEASSLVLAPRKRGRPPGSTKKVQVVKPMTRGFCEKCGRQNMEEDGEPHRCLPHQCRSVA